MRKNAWVICCCTAVLAAFGIFFRWLQDQVCFEEETGLAVRGSIWPYAVALMIVIAAVVLAVVCFRMKNQPHTSFPDSLPAAFVAVPRVRTIGGVVLGALLNGRALADACALAGEFVKDCIAYTAAQHTDPMHGVQFEKLLPRLFSCHENRTEV